MKIGVICPSEIAFRRFMPALEQIVDMEFVGLAICTMEERFGNDEFDENEIKEILHAEEVKAQAFIEQYGGKLFYGYENIVRSDEIEAIYIPLPPALHYKWAKLALECGKHVIVEKPATTSLRDTSELINIARSKGLVLHENYMFTFHKQLDAIEDIVRSREIGDVRLYRISFGFPMREKNDFRYNRALGGGALIDAGGYTLKYASRLLGDTAKVKYAQMNYINGYEVDMYGSAAVVNDDGVIAQVAFGMDNNYKCELEVWGSLGCLNSGRVLTAPAGYTPTVTVRKGNTDEVRNLPIDDAFRKSIEYFMGCIYNDESRENNYLNIIKQAEIVEQFKEKINDESGYYRCE